MTDQPRVTYRTPLGNRLGDLFTVAWQVPLFVFIAGFVVIMAAIGAGEFNDWEGSTVDYVMWTALLLLIPLPAAVFSARMFWWRLRLEPKQLRLGYLFLGGVEALYSSVTLIRETSAVSMEREREGANAIVIKTGRRELVFWVSKEKSRACLDALRERCRGAAAHTAEGEDLLPLDPDKAAQGAKVLGGFHLNAGRYALFGGTFISLVGGIMTTVAIARGEVPPFRAIAWLVAGFGLLAGGLASRTRGKVLRDQAGSAGAPPAAPEAPANPNPEA